ncbi:S-layer homology domain-containing protein [Paenibacillus sp. GP183]|uniref:S-layer homology domain-containing protein n=1 Tax=Paenibacillus sp. GP183 TaxID=1882751 RepID=UPI000896E777|nr:S-layer homology domain-containing protein [Paenibacillus sp. GP183]SEC33713.1 S-layer homology domain-containing protein [Paenibacillus sp. GP183]
MKQKRTLVWVILAAMLVSLFPFAPAGVVQAAPAYFVPDDSGISASNSLTLSTLQRSALSGGAIVSNGKVTIPGTLSFVDKDGITVTVDQLVNDPTTSTPGNLVLKPDPAHTYNKAVSATTTRFSADNLDMYPGFNRITFTGTQGGIPRTAVFYILYDAVPFMSNLTVSAGGSPAQNLSSGAASVVVSAAQILLQGTAQNTTQLTVDINGNANSKASVTVPATGNFNVPPLSFTAGLNTVNMTLSNGANTISLTRSLYYYDLNNPIIDMSITHTGDPTDPPNQPIMNQTVKPVLTGTTGAKGDLKVKMLIPFMSPTFNTANATFTLNGINVTSKVTPAPVETVIPSSPSYKLIDFTISAYDFNTTSTVPDIDQTVSLDVYYNGFHFVTKPPLPSFNYYPGSNQIQNVWQITGYPSTITTYDVDPTISVKPLNNSEVTSPNFYILVKAQKTLTDTKGTPATTPSYNSALNLKAFLQPIGTNVILESVGYYYNSSGTRDDTYQVYKVSGIPSGTQQIRFQVVGSAASPTFDTTVTYVNKNYINIDTLIDGQTIKYDSKISVAPTVNVQGSFTGSDPILSGTLDVNGTTRTLYSSSSSSPSFNLNLAIPSELHVGKNTLTFTGKFSQSGSVVLTVTKVITLYVVDTYVPVITQIQPTIIPATRIGLPPMSSSTLTAILSTIFVSQPDILFQNNHYVTSLNSHDFTFRATGATRAILKQGSTVIMDAAIPTSAINTQIPAASPLYAYDITGSETDFVIRVKDLQSTAPGTQTYVLQLYNAAGASISQTLQVERIYSDSRVISPQPNSGNQIVVTKNFVHFDVEAEGATEVQVDGKPAVARTDISNRFILDYIGLKPDKETPIKITIKRGALTTTKTVSVFYTSTVNVDSEFMEKLSAKHTVFNKDLELSFPRGTVLKRVISAQYPTTKIYNQTNLLFGIADPTDGVVGRVNDYGNILNSSNDGRSFQGRFPVLVSPVLKSRFTDPTDRLNFSRVSQMYWISGGYAEDSTYGPTGGLEPYTVNAGGDPANASMTYSVDPTVRINRTLVPSNRGTLKISFNDNVVEAVASNLTVFYFNDLGRWVNLGGEVDSKNHTISVPFDNFGYYMVGKLNNSYPDVEKHDWAKNVLEALYAKGYMNNLYAGNFGAYDKTSRGEFATLLVKSLNIPLNYDNNNSFIDVFPGSLAQTWDYRYIETAARAGIINGKDGRYFGVVENLTREQAATMIARALDLKMSINDAKLKTALSKVYGDVDSIYFYALPAIDAVTKAGIMVGRTTAPAPNQKKSTVFFDPKEELTRDQAGQIAIRLLQKSSNVFPKTLN